MACWDYCGRDSFLQFCAPHGTGSPSQAAVVPSLELRMAPHAVRMLRQIAGADAGDKPTVTDLRGGLGFEVTERVVGALIRSSLVTARWEGTGWKHAIAPGKDAAYQAIRRSFAPLMPPGASTSFDLTQALDPSKVLAVAQRLDLAPAIITHIGRNNKWLHKCLARLEGHGLVRSTAAPREKRRGHPGDKQYALTDAGRAWLAEFRAALAALGCAPA